MKGKKRVIIQNNRVHYEFVIKRNITIIQGDSASGKTTLVNMIRQAENLGESSGINVSCEVPCRVLEGVNWKIILENSRERVFFMTPTDIILLNTETFGTAGYDVPSAGRCCWAVMDGEIVARKWTVAMDAVAFPCRFMWSRIQEPPKDSFWNGCDSRIAKV